MSMQRMISSAIAFTCLTAACSSAGEKSPHANAVAGAELAAAVVAPNAAPATAPMPAPAPAEIAFECIQLSSEFFAEGAHFADLDKDGHNDIIAGPYWWEGPRFDKDAVENKIGCVLGYVIMKFGPFFL